MREDGVGGVYVESLSEHVVRNTAEVMRLLQIGAHLRITAMTKMNKVRICKPISFANSSVIIATHCTASFTYVLLFFRRVAVAMLYSRLLWSMQNMMVLEEV